MEIIKFQAIGEDDINIEGAVQGVGSFYIEGSGAIFTIESLSENKILEVRVNRSPFWNFSTGPYMSQMMRNPNWRNNRMVVSGPPLTEILELGVPEDSIIERVG